jgi:hypothetical protein
LPGLALNCDPPEVTRITGVSHWHQLKFLVVNILEIQKGNEEKNIRVPTTQSKKCKRPSYFHSNKKIRYLEISVVEEL